MATRDSAHRRLKASLAAVLQEIRVVNPDFPARFLPGRQGLRFQAWKPPKPGQH